MRQFLSKVFVIVVVVNLASRPPQFLGSASSAPEGLGSQDGANLHSKRLRNTLNKGKYPTYHHPSPTRPFVLTKSSGTASLVLARGYKVSRFSLAYFHKVLMASVLWHPTHTDSTNH